LLVASFLVATTVLLLLLLPVQILEIKTESQDLIAALNTLSAAYPDNTPAARRHLRSTIEERGLAINQQFLAAAEGVTQVCCKCNSVCLGTAQTCNVFLGSTDMQHARP
jgi:hypothetical protein